MTGVTIKQNIENERTCAGSSAWMVMYKKGVIWRNII